MRREGAGMTLLVVFFGLQVVAKDCVPEVETRVFASRDDFSSSFNLRLHPGGRYLIITGDARRTGLHDLQGGAVARQIEGLSSTQLSQPSGDFVISESRVGSVLETFNSFKDPARNAATNLDFGGRTLSLQELERTQNSVRLLRIDWQGRRTEIRATLNSDGRVVPTRVESKGRICSSIVDSTRNISRERKQELEGQIKVMGEALLVEAKQLLNLERAQQMATDAREITTQVLASAGRFAILQNQMHAALEELQPRGSYELADFSTDGEWVTLRQRGTNIAAIARIEGDTCTVRKVIGDQFAGQNPTFRKNPSGGLPQVQHVSNLLEWRDLETGAQFGQGGSYRTYPVFWPDGRIAYLTSANDNLVLNIVDPYQKMTTDPTQKAANCIERQASAATNSASPAGRR